MNIILENAINRFKRDKHLCYELIYDNLDDPKNIITAIAIDPSTMTKVIENNNIYWIQFKDNVGGTERKLLDRQIFYV